MKGFPEKITHLFESFPKHEAFDKLLRSSTALSFIRMGDGEFNFLLEMQSGKRADEDFALSGTASLDSGVRGAAANRVKDYPKVLSAYENADMVDLHLHLKPVRSRLHLLQWNPNSSGWQSTDEKDSRILPDWFKNCFKRYIADHRCLFYAAEAPLVESLLEFANYREIAKDFWPDTFEAIFSKPINWGAHLSRDYDLIKDEIREIVTRDSIDTVFLGASGLAKPLCVELAKELEIKMVDIGSLLRALSYSATAGPVTWPANHYPFFFRIPLNTYMDATRQAYPELKDHELIAKANAQMIFDLIKKDFSHSVPLRRATFAINGDNEYDEFLESMLYYSNELVKNSVRGKTISSQVADLYRWLYYNKYSELTPYRYRAMIFSRNIKDMLLKLLKA